MTDFLGSPKNQIFTASQKTHFCLHLHVLSWPSPPSTLQCPSNGYVEAFPSSPVLPKNIKLDCGALRIGFGWMKFGGGKEYLLLLKIRWQTFQTDGIHFFFELLDLFALPLPHNLHRIEPCNCKIGLSFSSDLNLSSGSSGFLWSQAERGATGRRQKPVGKTSIQLFLN